MKKIIVISVLVFRAFGTNAQNSSSNNVFIRHDTTTLKAANCEWIIKSLTRNDPRLNQELGKSLPQFFFGAIEKGKLKAFDAVTNEPIPDKKIFTWKMPSDSMMTYDDKGDDPKIVVRQRTHPTDKIDEVRIYHDWYLDVATGKIQSVIKWIELREQVYTATGLFLGYAALCRVFY